MSQPKHRVYRTGDEPVAGYQLHQFLGRGGFGEVWMVNGPGGVPAAMKIIHDLDRKHGGKELKALRLLRDIRHPNLVPLTAFWLKGDDGETMSSDSLWEIDPVDSVRGDSRGTMQLPTTSATSTAVLASSLPAELVIVMGLAEKSLYDRLRECTDEGWSGVPQEELLTYLTDAARAIDLLNIKHDIQHCDIKPQNILLLGGAAQVCDFGLAKVIGEVRETSMGAGTIAYGAPEVLIGKGPTATTDQYSLAISYVELRTGQLPFASERISDVLHAKQQGAVDLSQLSPAERDVIARAAANDPSQRFDTCCDMMRALRECSSAGGLPLTQSSRPRALVDTDRGRTTTCERMTAVTPRMGWGFAITGIVTVVAVLGSAAWIVASRAASQSAIRSENETLVAAEQALAAAAAALDRANQQSRQHEPAAPTSAVAAPVESAAQKEPPCEPESPPSAITSTVSESAPAPLNSQPATHTETDATQDSNPPAPVPAATVSSAADLPAAVPLADKSLEAALNQIATATATSAALSETIATATQQAAAPTQPIVSTTEKTVPAPDPLAEKQAPAANPTGNNDHPYHPSDFNHNASLVRISAQLTNDSWIVSLVLAEAAKEIWCRVGGAGEFESTGFQDFGEHRTGSPIPKSFLPLPLDTPTTSLFVKYTDNRGRERGPFELAFEPEQQRQSHGKQILEGFPHNWVSIGDSNGKRLAQFSHLLSYRYALREIRYSIDTQELSETIPLPDWSRTRPNETPADAKTTIELPAGAKFVAIQLTYQDGTQSKPQRFNVSQ